MQKIAIDTQPLSNPQKTGHAYYVEALLSALQARQSFNIIACSPDNKSDLRTLDRFTWDQKQLPRLAEKAGAELLITTAFSVPRTKMPTIAIVHDLSLLRFPQNMKGVSGYFLRKYVPKTFKRASMCVAISEATKRDMVELLKIDPHKIQVIYSGVDSFYKPVTTRSIQKKLQLPEKYCITVGTLEPRKNISFLLEAIAKKLKQHQVPLVLVGKRGWLYEEIFQKRQQLGLEDLVIEAGYVSQAEKRELYSGASALLYPSLYEGFGMPILEAMACGTPVIAANTSSIPEVVGDAGILLPLEEKAWEEAFEQCILDSNSMQKYVALGYERVRQFTWDKTAQELETVITNLLRS